MAADSLVKWIFLNYSIILAIFYASSNSWLVDQRRFFPDMAESALVHQPVGSNLTTQAVYTIHMVNIPANMKKSGIENLCRRHGKVLNVDVCYVVRIL